MLVRFICGCTLDVNQEDIGWWREISMDNEGFLICTIHKMRREGYRSLPTTGTRNMPNWKMAHLTYREIEQHVIFGTPLPVRKWEPQNSTPDLRDNRDPVALGQEILAKKNGDMN